MPKKWENNWDKVINNEAEDFRNRKLLTLGNLAIITQSLNASIRDSNWETKREAREVTGLIRYSAGMETLSSYLEIVDWNESEIEKRALDLYKYALDIWKI